jgi:hypothetical protein
VPLIVRWPGHVRAGEVRTDLVSFIDLPPTTLALAGLPVPKHFQGQVFIGSQRAPDREFVYVHRDRMDEVPDTIRAVRDRRYKYIRNFFPDRPYATRLAFAEQVPMLQEWRREHAAGRLRGPQLLFFSATKPAEELYDTERDPHEVSNLATVDAERPRLERMRAALDRWMRDTGDLGLVPEAELMARARPDGRWSTASVPRIDPPGGTFTGPLDVRLTCRTEGSTIVYSEREGNAVRWQLYTTPLRITAGLTLRAKCGRLGFQDSAEARAVFVVAPAVDRRR